MFYVCALPETTDYSSNDNKIKYIVAIVTMTRAKSMVGRYNLASLEMLTVYRASGC